MKMSPDTHTLCYTVCMYEKFVMRNSKIQSPDLMDTKWKNKTTVKSVYPFNVCVVLSAYGKWDEGDNC